jgi:CDP-diacylglycerol--glycerol-3-phosphate 3-phosphatidyltransferase
VPVFLILFFSGSAVWEFCATLVFIGSAITDHYDGKIARRRKEVTEFGRFADPLADKFLTLSAFISFLIREDFGSLTTLTLIYIIIIAVREFGITFLRMWAISQSAPLITSLWGKLKTTFQLIAIIFALVYFNARDLLPEIGLKLNFLRDAIFFPLIHGLILICMIVTVISGTLYFTATKFESRNQSR